MYINNCNSHIGQNQIHLQLSLHNCELIIGVFRFRGFQAESSSRSNLPNVSVAGPEPGPEVVHPGTCPALPKGIAGICVEMCSSDADCPPDSKCCSNGCGHVCKKAVVGE